MVSFPLFSEWSSTQRLGVYSYAGSSLVCGVLAARQGRSVFRSSYLFNIAVFGAIWQALMTADMVTGWRLALHNALARLFVQYNLYQIRHLFQVGSLLLFGAICTFFLRGIALRFRSRPGALIAISGMSFSFILWAMEVISLHETDRILYHVLHGTMAIAYLWLMVAVLTASGIAIDVLTMDKKRAPRS